MGKERGRKTERGREGGSKGGGRERQGGKWDLGSGEARVQT